jgi:hypothetical protein
MSEAGRLAPAPRTLLVGFFVALLIGAILRLLWLSDMEYKVDEAWTYDRVEAFRHTRQLPGLGMPSNAGLPNAGLSFWVFAVLGRLVAAGDPVALARAIGVVNIVALVLLALFAYRTVDPPARAPWLWSVSLVSVNPFAVLFSRKIWPPDILPLFTVGFLFGWWNRQRWWGALRWGLVGALLGQIELWGFSFAFAFFVVTLVFARKSVCWWAWTLGSTLGSLPMLGWLWALLHPHSAGATGSGWHLAPDFVMFVPLWFNFASGINLSYSLGADMLPFLASPRIFGLPSFFGALCVAVLAACLGVTLTRIIRQFAAQPAVMRARLFGSRSSTALGLYAAFGVYGLGFAASPRAVHMHYLVFAFCLPALSFVYLIRAGTRANRLCASSRQILFAFWLAQAGLSFAFLGYIHHAKTIDGDYGVPYGEGSVGTRAIQGTYRRPLENPRPGPALEPAGESPETP